MLPPQRRSRPVRPERRRLRAGPLVLVLALASLGVSPAAQASTTSSSTTTTSSTPGSTTTTSSTPGSTTTTSSTPGSTTTTSSTPGSTTTSSSTTTTTSTPGSADPILSPLTTSRRAHGGRFLVKGQRSAVRLRGFDYQPLTAVKRRHQHPKYQNETFALAYYHHRAIVRMLKGWQAEGYNTVRVFLNPSQIGNPKGTGLDPGYLGNVADFVETAAQYDVRTLVTIGTLPSQGGFTPQTSQRFGTVNEYYLSPAFITAEKRYLRALVGGLRKDGAPLVDVLWELKGEQNWDNWSAPLSWKAGRVRTANGRTYNMAVASSRVAMENGNLVHWTNALSSTIHRLVPGSLVGVGVYPPSVRRRKWTVRPEVLFQSATQNDFVDIHVYPNLGPEQTQIDSFHAGSTRKPVIMGEFGATRSASVKAAGKALLSWQQRSCNLDGLSVSGWLLWTWNSNADVEFWDALAGHGLLGRVLAPSNRPNPCR